MRPPQPKVNLQLAADRRIRSKPESRLMGMSHNTHDTCRIDSPGAESNDTIVMVSFEWLCHWGIGG
jgi:hypothetical protein